MANLRLTKPEILKRFTLTHGTTYDYSKLIYDGLGEKVIVVCRKHGEFLVTPGNHQAGRGCPSCGKKAKSFTSNKQFRSFIDSTFLGEVLAGPFTKYAGMLSKTAVICRKHGKYTVSCRTLASGKSGCRSCHNDKLLHNRLRETDQSNLDLSGIKFTHRRHFISVTCTKHGAFKIMAQLIHRGCPTCRRAKIFKRKLKTLSKTRDYDYSECSIRFYLKTKRITPICKEHGKFEQEYRAHKRGQGCPVCGSLKNPEVFHKWKTSMYKMKPYVLKDGRKILVQGYEGLAIEILETERSARSLKFDSDIPAIPYILNGKEHVYYPDIFYRNTIVEVKSTWTWKKDKSKNIAKLDSALSSGYCVRLMIFDGQEKCVKDIIRSPDGKTKRHDHLH